MDHMIETCKKYFQLGLLILAAGALFGCASAPTSTSSSSANPPIPSFQVAIVTDCSVFDVALNVFNSLDDQGVLNSNEKIAIGQAIGVENANCSAPLPTTSTAAVTTAVQSIATAVSSLGATQAEVVSGHPTGTIYSEIISTVISATPAVVNDFNSVMSLYKSGQDSPTQLATSWTNLQADIKAQVAEWESANPGTVP